VVLVMRNGHRLSARKAWSDVEWFVRQGRSWRRHQERVEEVCWDAKTIARVLKASGFATIHAWDEAPFFPDQEPGSRTVYLARKKARTQANGRSI